MRIMINFSAVMAMVARVAVLTEPMLGTDEMLLLVLVLLLLLLLLLRLCQSCGSSYWRFARMPCGSRLCHIEEYCWLQAQASMEAAELCS